MRSVAAGRPNGAVNNVYRHARTLTLTRSHSHAHTLTLTHASRSSFVATPLLGFGAYNIIVFVCNSGPCSSLKDKKKCIRYGYQNHNVVVATIKQLPRDNFRIDPVDQTELDCYYVFYFVFYFGSGSRQKVNKQFPRSVLYPLRDCGPASCVKRVGARLYIAAVNA